MSDVAMSVTIEWFGCATFRVRAGELTLFFDTYLDKAPGVPPAGLRAAEVDRADFLFISHAQVIFCYYDPLLPPLLGATDITAAETRLKEMPDQGYLRLEYGAPTAILAKRS